MGGRENVKDPAQPLYNQYDTTDKDDSESVDEIKGCLPKGCYTDNCSRNLFQLFASMFLLGILIFGIYYYYKVAPHFEATTFIKTNCTVVNANYTGNLMPCECPGKRCRSTYPCFQVFVQLLDLEGEPISQLSFNENYIGRTCSYGQCNYNENSNSDAVKQFISLYGNVGDIFTCQYNINDVNVTIVELFDSYSKVIHNIIWPAVVSGVGVAGVIITGLFRGTKMLPLKVQSCCSDRQL